MINSINEIIRRYFKDEELYSVEGVVSNVRESARLCDFTPLDGAMINDVKLNSAEDSDTGLVLIPTTGTNAIVTFINPDLAYLCLPESVDKVLVKINNTTLEINDGNTIFNGGSNDGLINIQDLVTKLNNVEDDLNDIKTAFATWVTVPNDGGAALKAAAAVWSAASLTPTVQANLEDTKIKH